jgi:GH18 family chitinase
MIENITLKFYSLADGAFLNDIKTIQNKGVNVIVSVGHAYSFNYKHFSEMAANLESRKKFVESVKSIMEKYSFDGSILQWKHPACPDVKYGNLIIKSVFLNVYNCAIIIIFDII